MLDDFFVSITTLEQRKLEQKISKIYKLFLSADSVRKKELLTLNRDHHKRFLLSALKSLPEWADALDAVRAWVAFWVSHSLALLGVELAQEDQNGIIQFIRSCEHPDGGYGGGPFQLPHLATSYAAISTLITIGGETALSSIDRKKIFDFLRRSCASEGGFRVCDGGEIDARGCYCAMAICDMLNLDSELLVKESNMIQFLQECQTYEGGLAGEPGAEAHGGYAFCALAALAFVEKAHVLDLQLLQEWVARCQGEIEGGFRGRTNKLVDGCYSYWMGALFPLLKQLGIQSPQINSSQIPCLFLNTSTVDMLDELEVPVNSPQVILQKSKQKADQRYQELQTQLKQSFTSQDHAYSELILDEGIKKLAKQCEEAEIRGGKINEDLTASTNSAYQVVSSLSDQQINDYYNFRALQIWLLLCSQSIKGGFVDKPGKAVDFYHTCYCLSGLSAAQWWSGEALPSKNNLLEKTNILCNVVQNKYEEANQFFAAKINV